MGEKKFDFFIQMMDGDGIFCSLCMGSWRFSMEK